VLATLSAFVCGRPRGTRSLRVIICARSALRPLSAFSSGLNGEQVGYFDIGLALN
jgi:hypothetical protein